MIKATCCSRIAYLFYVDTVVVRVKDLPENILSPVGLVCVPMRQDVGS